MPGLDGCAVLSEVEALETTLRRQVPVVAVTAYAHAEDRERTMAASFADYLAKPIDP
jgi:CheY-like chemotaxis protein